MAADVGMAAAHNGSGAIPILPIQNTTYVPILNITVKEPAGTVIAARDSTQLALIHISATLSILGALFIIASYYLFKDSRKFSRKILVFLSLADLASASIWIWSTFISTQLSDPSTQCQVQGFLLQMFYLASYVWTSCFAFNLYQLIWRKNSTEKFEKYYHACGWGFPILIDVYFLVKYALDDPSMGNVERPWCWISSETPTTAWSFSGAIQQLLFFYIPLIILFVYNFAVYVFLSRVVGKVLAPSMETKIRKRLLLYLAVFGLCSIWGLFNRIYVFFSPMHGLPSWLVSLESFFSPLQGFLNALVYGLNEQLRDRYAAMICGRKSKSRSQETPVFSSRVVSHSAVDSEHSEAAAYRPL